MYETPAQFARRNKAIKENQKTLISSGGCSHELSTMTSIGLPGGEEPIDPVVMMVNDLDNFFVQVFKSREEIEEFIQELQTEADKAWPPKIKEN